MIDKETFHPLNYIKKEEYSGSMDGMRYMLKKVSIKISDAIPADEEKGIEEVKAVFEDKILVTVWPEPYGIHATTDELKIMEYFPLDADGVSDAADWINDQFFNNQDKWKKALEGGLLQ